MAQPTGNKAGRSATGSFDFDILKQLIAIQGGIRRLNVMISKQQEKPYQKAIDNLQKAVPKEKEKKEKFQIKLPKLPSGKSILDGLFGIGKIALAGAFLAGLLKDKIVEMFNAWEPESLIAKVFKGILTKDMNEADWGTRIREALIKAGIGAIIGGALGLLVGGPIGVLGGALIGAGIGGFVSILQSDTSAGAMDAKKVIEGIKKHAKFMGTVGALGAALGTLFGATVPGFIAGAMLGLAISYIDTLFVRARMNDAEGAWDGILRTWVMSAVGWLGDLMKKVGNFFIKQINKIIPGTGFDIPLMAEDSIEMNRIQGELIPVQSVRDVLEHTDDYRLGGEGATLSNSGTANIDRVAELTGFNLREEAKNYPDTYPGKDGGAYTTQSARLEKLWPVLNQEADLIERLRAATARRDAGNADMPETFYEKNQGFKNYSVTGTSATDVDFGILESADAKLKEKIAAQISSAARGLEVASKVVVVPVADGGGGGDVNVFNSNGGSNDVTSTRDDTTEILNKGNLQNKVIWSWIR